MSIDPLDTPPLRRQAVMFHAQASDPDGDTPSLQWGLGPFDCTNPPGVWTMPDPNAKSYMVPGEETDGPFCVWVKATDSHGASQTDNKGIDPKDQPPSAEIKIVSPDPTTAVTNAGVSYPLYSTVELSPTSSDPEGDSLMPPNLVLDHVPAGSAAVLMPCGPANGADQCFVADVPGEYDVSLTVADSFGKQGTATPQKIIVLSDQPPCIGSSDPDFLSPMVEVTLPSPTDPMPDPLPSLTIHSVADDGAPWPPGPNGGATFRWYVSTDGQHFQFANNDYPTLPLGSTGLHKTGDIVKVRVEVSDRNPKNDAALTGCNDNDDTCQAVPGCFQRVTWSVDFR